MAACCGLDKEFPVWQKHFLAEKGLQYVKELFMHYSSGKA